MEDRLAQIRRRLGKLPGSASWERILGAPRFSFFPNLATRRETHTSNLRWNVG